MQYVIIIILALIVVVLFILKDRRKDHEPETPIQQSLWQEEKYASDIRNHPHNYYDFKRCFMNENESWAYHYISKALCEIYGTFQTPPGKQNFKDNNNPYAIFENRAQLFVFPQPNLYAFVQHKRSIEKERRSVVHHVMGGKSVDFLICKREMDRRNGHFIYSFRPVLAVELDGITHDKNYATSRQYQNDQFKDRLFSKEDSDGPIKNWIPLMRYQFRKPMTRKDGSYYYVFAQEDEEGIREMLRDYLNNVL